MEHHSFSSHPNSGNSSPQSRELLDNDNRSSFDELPPSSNGYKVKLMISYGGKIQPRSHDKHFSYIGGDTKILAVDRTVKLSTLIAKLSSLANSDVCFKYQLPGEDLDALISVTNEEDLDQMMIEYDRLYRASPKPARLRLFLFPIPNKNANASSGSSVSAINLTAAEDSKSEGNWFVEALNSVHVAPLEDSSPPPTTNPDYLFGLDKPYSAANQAELPETVPDFAAKDTECGPETVRETEIHEVQAANNEQQIKIDGEKGRINGSVDCYTTEKVTPLVTNVPAHHTQVQLHSGSIPVHVRGPVPVHVSGPVPVQSSLSQERYNVALASGYSMGYPNEVSPVYLIQTASGFYQAVRPVTGPTGQPVYFAYSQIVNNVAYNNGSDVPDMVSERGYSYFPDRSALPRQAAAAAPGGDGWN